MTLAEFKYLTSVCWNKRYQPITIDMTKDKYTGRYRLGLNSIFVPDTSPFLEESIYSNVTEKDLDNLRKLAEQQKNQRAIEIKNRILKQTHDVKLAESLSPITKKLDEVNKSTQELGDVIKESKPETPQLAIANTQTPAIENITVSNSLRDTLSFMKKSKNFFKLEQW